MIRLMHFTPDTRICSHEEISALPAKYKDVRVGERYWIDLQDATPEEEEQVLVKFMPVHPLTLEDVTRMRRLPDQGAHLPKVEEFEDYLFVIVNPLPLAACDPNRGKDLLKNERWKRPQLSAILTHRVLITHHLTDLTCIESVRNVLQQRGELLHRGPDYLFHLILDGMVDEYAPVVERFAGRLDKLEIMLFQSGHRSVLTRLIQMKRRVLFLRKTLVLEREVLARLVRAEFDLVTDSEIHYYRNVYDHLVRYTELIEGAREMTSDLMQLHLAAASNRLNEVMKILTMLSILIGVPTLIAGIYGMNFRKGMPELDWEYGYAFSLGLMAISSLVALVWFKWKKWL